MRIAEVLGLSRQAINNRVKELPEEDTDKNDKGGNSLLPEVA